jgi:hypothetical protein
MMSLSCNLGLTENQKQPDHQIERQKTSERVTSTLKQKQTFITGWYLVSKGASAAGIWNCLSK